MIDAPCHDCDLCPRLVDYREANRAANPDWFNGPVPSFGDPAARLLVVGMAPGVRGANRTGRPFTGDHAGHLLYTSLLKFGFAKGIYLAEPNDGLTLQDCRIANAVRCVPPANLPVPLEVTTCNRFLVAELQGMVNLRVVLALGVLAPCGGAEGMRHSAVPNSLPTRPDPSFAGRTEARKQLSCVALQHEYRPPDGGNVRGRDDGYRPDADSDQLTR